MCLLLHQVGTVDLRVGDRDELVPSAASVTSVSEAPTSSPVSCAGCGLRRVGADVGGDSPRGAHTSATPDEAAEVLGLGQRALEPGRGDLERVALAQLRRALA